MQPSSAAGLCCFSLLLALRASANGDSAGPSPESSTFHPDVSVVGGVRSVDGYVGWGPAGGLEVGLALLRFGGVRLSAAVVGTGFEVQNIYKDWLAGFELNPGLQLELRVGFLRLQLEAAAGVARWGYTVGWNTKYDVDYPTELWFVDAQVGVGLGIESPIRGLGVRIQAREIWVSEFFPYPPHTSTSTMVLGGLGYSF